MQRDRNGMELPTGRKFWVMVYIVPWFILGFMTAIFLRNSSKNSSVTSLDPKSAGFSWESIPWKSNNKLKMSLVPTYPIAFAGEPTSTTQNAYRSVINISEPRYASVASTCMTSDGFVVHSGKEYPHNHPWFPKFDLKKFNHQPKNSIYYPRMIYIPQPPDMSDQFFLSNIFPLIFSLPEEILSSSTLGFTRLSPALKEFFKSVKFKMDNIVTAETSNQCAEQMIVPLIPQPNQISQASYTMMSQSIHQIIEEKDSASILITRDGDPKLRRRDAITKKMSDSGDFVQVFNKMWNIYDQIFAVANCKLLIGFDGEQSNLVAFLRPGSAFIEIQRDNSVSRSVLLARALGFKTFTILIKDGDVINDNILDTINSISANL